MFYLKFVYSIFEQKNRFTSMSAEESVYVKLSRFMWSENLNVICKKVKNIKPLSGNAL